MPLDAITVAVGRLAVSDPVPGALGDDAREGALPATVPLLADRATD